MDGLAIRPTYYASPGLSQASSDGCIGKSRPVSVRRSIRSRLLAHRWPIAFCHPAADGQDAGLFSSRTLRSLANSGRAKADIVVAVAGVVRVAVRAPHVPRVPVPTAAPQRTLGAPATRTQRAILRVGPFASQVCRMGTNCLASVFPFRHHVAQTLASAGGPSAPKGPNMSARGKRSAAPG